MNTLDQSGIVISHMDDGESKPSLGVTSDETITLEYDTSLTANGSRPMYHHQIDVITSESVTVTIYGHGDDCATHEPVTSTDPAVVAFFRQIQTVREVTSYANRPVD